MLRCPNNNHTALSGQWKQSVYTKKLDKNEILVRKIQRVKRSHNALNKFSNDLKYVE